MDIFDTVFTDGQDSVQLQKIIIPIIQRDYAQGRRDPDIARVRKRFLDSLRSAIDGTPITLDFVYELYARLVFTLQFFKKTYGEASFLCVDEGQDLAFNEYRLLYELSDHRVTFNIFGDVNQLMKPGRGISDWSELQKAFHAEQFYLNENYRNTNQITRFCNSSFDMDVKRTGVDGPSVREIARRDLEDEIRNMKTAADKVAILVPRSVHKNDYIDYALLPFDTARMIGNEIDNGRVSLMYVDEVKGIEFDRAYVVINGMSKNEKYIAYTRALSELVIVVDEKLDVHNESEGVELVI